MTEQSPVERIKRNSRNLRGTLVESLQDPLTGAMWKLEPTVQAELTPLAVIDSGNGRRMTVVDRSAVPAHLKDQLVALR